MTPAEQLADALEHACPGVFPQYARGPASVRIDPRAHLVMLLRGLDLLATTRPWAHTWVTAQLSSDDIDTLSVAVVPLLRALGREVGHRPPPPRWDSPRAPRHESAAEYGSAGLRCADTQQATGVVAGVVTPQDSNETTS